jgi:predicted nuclease with TOPRIM domain
MWDWLIWGALIFAFVAGIAALVLLVRRSREAYRELDRSRETVGREVDELAARAEAAAARAEAAAGDTSELQRSLERLRVSLAQLSVLTEALDEAHDMAARVAAFVPRK